ncbi:MAG TPA: M48 family metallopeptidase [Thermoanaerobaculia bacterium]|nr:M48 family metallopeptidase [Thermoanaerobaculia bacterium]
MDFFATQERAQRHTARLMALFALAVGGVVACVYLAVRLLIYKTEDGPTGPFWNPKVFMPVATITIAVIALSTLYKIWSLRSGSEAIANLLGARRIAPNTTEPAERRLLNVVEEMALAAGLPVPSVVVLDNEPGINAFAAGWAPGDSILGVTRGCLDRLERDELQGVIGHELSHILNADARLNLHLIGWLHGLMVIAFIGYWILRSMGRSSGSSKKGGGAAIPLFGLALIVIGGIGVFFGRLIKSGISRQREFLADASSVQFTRNPLGLADALKKIGGAKDGSKIANPNAEQASHLYFSNGLKASWLSALSTHPPLEDRIRRLDPSFTGTFAATDPGPKLRPVIGVEIPENEERLAAGVVGLGGHTIAARVGTVQPTHVDYATQFIASLPAGLRERAREPATAPALLFALLLDRDPEVRIVQVRALEGAGPFLFDETQKAAAILASCPDAARLPLLDLALPALRQMSRPQWDAFRITTHALIVADSRISLFELVLQRALVRHLGPVFGGTRAKGAPTAQLSDRTTEVGLVLSALGHACGSDEPAAEAASFDAALCLLGGDAGSITFSSRDDCPPEVIDRALRSLAALVPQGKKRLLEAATACAVADRKVTVAEAELLRAIADSLDCPVPPFLPGQEV